MHKKHLSLLLALSISANLGVPTFAADNQTEVTYIGTATENYLLTVPATLEPGEQGDPRQTKKSGIFLAEF